MNLANLFVRAFGEEGTQGLRKFLKEDDTWTNRKIKDFSDRRNPCGVIMLTSKLVFQRDLRDARTHLEQLLVAYRTYHETLVEGKLRQRCQYETA